MTGGPAERAAPRPAMPRTRSDRAWLLGLFVGALLWRLLHLLTVRGSPLFDHLFIDPKMYDEWGRAIAGGQLLGRAPFFLDPLYPYFLGTIYALVGRSLLAVALVQSVFGALVAPLVLDAARPWFGRAVARTAAIVAAVYPPAVFFGAVLMKPGLALFLVALMLWLLSRAELRGRSLDWLLAGAALGLACLARGNLLWVVPVLAIVAGFEGPDETGARSRRGLRAAAGLVAGTTLVLLVPLGHNWAVSGEPILTTTNWGQIFFIGNNADNPNGRFMELPFVRSNPTYEQTDFKHEAERRTGRAMSHVEVSRFWFGQGLDWIRSHPADWARLQWSKLRVFWGGYETPASLDFYFYRRLAPLLRLPLPGFGLLGPFALLGTLLALGRAGWPRSLAVFVIAGTLSVVAFFVLTRFRLALAPALYVLAAFGAVELAGRGRRALRGEGRAAAVALAAALLAFFAFVNLPVQATADTWSYRVAATLGIPRRLETTANAHFNLGVTYAALAAESDDEQRVLGQAEAELRAALAEDAQAKTFVELGKVLAREGRDDEAVEAFGQALQRDPYDFRVHHTLGLLHARSGRPQEAEIEFREALRLAPRHVASAVRLGETLLEQGRDEEAAEAFRYALGLDPADADARAGLDRARRSGARH